MLDQAPASFYELALRESDGVEVALLWDGVDDRVLLNIRNRRTGTWFVFGIDHGNALDAFRHPFAYAARERTRPTRRLLQPRDRNGRCS